MSSCLFGLNPPWRHGKSSCYGLECTAEHRANVYRSPSSILEEHCLFTLLSWKYESGLWIRCSRRANSWPALLSTAHIYCHDFTFNEKPPPKKHCSQGVGVMHLLLWQLYLPRHPQSQERWDALQNKSFWSVIILGVGAGARAVVNGSINLLDKYQRPKSFHRCGCKRGCVNRWLLLLSAGGTWEV